MWITLIPTPTPGPSQVPDTRGAALTEAQGLSADAHHPPQLP